MLLNLLSWPFCEDNARLFCQVLNSSFFCSNRQFYGGFLPFVGTTFNSTNRVLSKHNIKMVCFQKVSSFLHFVKDDLALKIPGLYGILWEFGIVCTCQLRPFSQSITSISACHQKKSAVAEHSTNLGHCTQLQDTSILAKKFIIHRPGYQGSNRDSAPSQQHEEGRQYTGSSQGHGMHFPLSVCCPWFL
jgi:hypothetical protein